MQSYIHILQVFRQLDGVNTKCLTLNVLAQVRKQANSQGRPARASVPVKSAAEAFLENDLSAGVQRRKPKKAVAVAAR